MRMTVVCIFDRVAVVYGRPWCAVSRGAAIRTFGELVRDKNTEFSKHPADYDLFLLGEYDDATGQFMCGVPDQIALGQDQVQV